MGLLAHLQQPLQHGYTVYTRSTLARPGFAVLCVIVSGERNARGLALWCRVWTLGKDGGGPSQNSRGQDITKITRTSHVGVMSRGGMISTSCDINLMSQ